jgi:hypothetical protein
MNYKGLSSEVISVIKSIEISHCFAKNFNHGIEKKSGKWDMFEPTRFVYAFFAFNMIYSIDWAKSVNRRSVWFHRNKSTTTKEQFQILVDFIHSNDSTQFYRELKFLDKNDDLFEIVSKLIMDYKISLDSTYKPKVSIAEAFLEVAENYSGGSNINSKEHLIFLEFVYAVRNNFFHGEKKSSDLKEQNHRNRLYQYGNIILATNESFFEVLRKNFDYRRVEDFIVEESI